MTDHPYTDADLRTEAARQHHDLTEDPDYVGVGEQMGSEPMHTDPMCWDALGEDDFNTAQRAIHDLIDHAANTSDWAVNLGADGLTPDSRALDAGPNDQPSMRIHFAFAPYLSDDDRADLIGQFAAFMTHGLT